MHAGAVQDIAVATPERVSLSLPVAGVGSRVLAYLVDLGLLFTGWIVLYFGLTLLVSDLVGLFEGLSGVVQTVLVVSVFAVQWMYWTACEQAMNGQTPGKRVLRIRVVRLDGSPVGFLESAVRNLCRAIDFLPVGYAAGLLTMLVNREHRRLGDLLAGTLLVRERAIDLDRYVVMATPVEALPVGPAAPTPSVAAPRLSPSELELVLDYLERTPWLVPAARERLAGQLFARFGAQLPEPERAAAGASVESIERFLRERASGRS